MKEEKKELTIRDTQNTKDTLTSTSEEMKCPKCGSSNITKTKLTTFEQISRFWFIYIMLAAVAARYMPILIVPCLFLGVFCFVTHKKRTTGARIATAMDCQHCQNHFFVPTAEGLKLAAEDLEKEMKHTAKETATKEEKEALARENSLNGFGRMEEGEKLWHEFDPANYRRSLYSTESGKLKITDHGLIWYSRVSRVRINKKDIKSINKRNYYNIAPTGIEVHTSEKVHQFVLPTKTRNAIFNTIEKSLSKMKEEPLQ